MEVRSFPSSVSPVNTTQDPIALFDLLREGVKLHFHDGSTLRVGEDHPSPQEFPPS